MVRGNPSKLRKLTTQQAREIGSKGGRVRSLAKKLINRKFCNYGCPLYTNCWAKHTSHALHEKAVAKAIKEGWKEKEIQAIKIECSLKKMPSQVIEGTKRIILDGEEGFNNEMMEQIMRLKNDILIGNVGPKSRERYMYQLRETKKSIFGDKSRLEANVNQDTITADDFAIAYDEHKKNEKEAEKVKKDEAKIAEVPSA